MDQKTKILTMQDLELESIANWISIPYLEARLYPISAESSQSSGFPVPLFG